MTDNPLHDLVEAVFPPHPLDPADAFRDWGGTYLDAQDFKAGVRDRAWPSLDGAFLEFHHDALYALGPAFLAEYLPACLAALLRNDEALDALPGFVVGVLTRRAPDRDPESRFEARIGALTDPQKRTIAEVFRHLEWISVDPVRKKSFEEALDSYWRDYLDPVAR